MQVNINQIGVYKDEGYYRVFIKYGTHTFHSEKLNKETASNLLFEMEDTV